MGKGIEMGWKRKYVPSDENCLAGSGHCRAQRREAVKERDIRLQKSGLRPKVLVLRNRSKGPERRGLSASSANNWNIQP